MSSEYPKELEYSTQEGITLLDYISVMVKHRRMILGLSSAVVIMAVVISLLLPKIYSARAVIMPPKTEEAMSGLAAQLGGLRALAGGVLNISNPAQVYVDMLKSRSVTDAIIDRFNLQEVYDVELMKDARKELGGNVDVVISEADTISITVEDKQPERAADITNAYVEELDKLSQRLSISDAARQRMFMEKRLEETKQGLVKAESKLKEFQEQHKIVALDEQARVSLQGAAKIKGEIIAVETELEVLKSFVTGKSNKVLRLEQKLVELNGQLTRIESGENIDNSDHSENPKHRSNFYLSFNQVPDLGLKLSRLRREVDIQETVFELLTQQHELAKIAEAKDTATIQVLDIAVVPEEESKPRRMLIVVSSGIVTLFLSMFLAIIFEYFERMNAEDKKRWQAVKLVVTESIPFTKKENT